MSSLRGGLGLGGLRGGLGLSSLRGGLGLGGRRFGRRRCERKIHIRRQQIVQFLLRRFPFGRRILSRGGGRQHRIPHIRHERGQIRVECGFDVVIRRRTRRSGRRAAAHVAQQIFHRVPRGSRRSRLGSGGRAAAHVAQQVFHRVPGGSRRSRCGLGRSGGRRRHFDARGREEILHRAVQRRPFLYRRGRDRMRLTGDIQMVQQIVHIVNAGHNDLFVGILIRPLRRNIRPGKAGGTQFLHFLRRSRALPHLLQQAADGIIRRMRDVVETLQLFGQTVLFRGWTGSLCGGFPLLDKVGQVNDFFGISRHGSLAG